MATWWEILTKERRIKGLPYDENHWLTKSRETNDQSWELLWQIAEGKSNAPISSLSAPVRAWLEDNGPK